jgi:methyltransferase (TIGR00027 family)
MAMPTITGSITHVSDTARWVAVYRAMESERPDALFHDPYARRLAGAHGEAIVETIPRGRQMAWAMIVRTQVFDEIILEKVRTDGVDLVLNIAAGLDARPWRLELPPALRWVDVDFPDMIAYKSAELGGIAAKCDYRAVATDLSDARTRKAALADAVAGAQRVLVVAEGLLIYLTAEQVASLSADLAALPAARWWLIDLASPRLLQWMTKSWGKRVNHDTTSQFKFAPEEGTAFFAPSGWREERWVSSMDASRRLKREMRGAWLWRMIGMLYPKRVREQFKRFSGYALLERGR